MKQRLDDDIEAAEAGLHADAERELWNFFETFFVQAFKILGTENLLTFL